MAKTFTPLVTVIPADWLNPVSVLVEDVFLQATNALEARTAIYACEQSLDDSLYYIRQSRTWVEFDLDGCCFPEAPLDGLAYVRQSEDGIDGSWQRGARVYVQAIDPAL